MGKNTAASCGDYGEEAAYNTRATKAPGFGMATEPLFGVTHMGSAFTRKVSLTRLFRLSLAFVFLSVSSALGANPIPTITGPVQPQAVAPGGGAFTLTVYGANFVSGATVNWNRKARAATFVSARELKAKIQASDIAKPTAGFISVTNPAPGGGLSSSSYGLVEVHEPTSKISLSTVNNYLPGDVIWYLATADFNNDGILDIAVGDGASIFLYLGNGDGTFRLGSRVTDNFIASGANFAYGDFNGDGNLDLAFASGQEESSQVTVVLGNGDGTFRPGSIFGKFTHYPVLVVGDFNRDGQLDVAVGGAIRSSGTYVNVFLGKGNGAFKQHAKYPIFNPYFISTADFNGDGVLDLIFVHELSNGAPSIALMLGKGDGTFGKMHTIAEPQGICDAIARPVAIDDFNEDGKLDLAFCQTTQIGVKLGNGDGTFGKSKFYSIPDKQCGFTFAVGDFTSDNRSDFLVSYCYHTNTGYKDAAEYLLGNGDGTFQNRHGLKIPEGGVAEGGIVPEDFNADGLLDFIFGFALGGFSVFPQQ